MPSSHSNDPPTSPHGQNNNVEGAIDPSLTAPTSAESTSVPDDENSLKRTWLTLLPVEQVIEIVMKLDVNVPQSVRKDVWPMDLKAAVFHAAVAKIMESSGKGNAQDVLKSLESSAAQDAKKDVEGARTASESIAPNGPPTSTPGPVQSAVPSSHSPLPAASPAPVPLSTAVLPLTSTIPNASAATSTTTYQAASSSYSYTYPYSSGSYSYQHSANHQPYSYTYSPASGSTSYSPAPPPPRVPPPPGTIPSPGDEDDLPSYEEMLVQALTVHNDPEGTAPKQLFQWMAATYPLQANFRPSASQALQKAYKRGRFEKNKEGKYRLNALWEGGNTSRRTTRRPQSYSKAVTNPSPSSHPPAHTSQFPPQHFTWTYGGARTSKSHSQSQSPAPPTPAPTTVPQHPPPSMKPQPDPEPVSTVAPVQGDAEQESHRSCMEAAYSILQALNVTSAFNVAKAGEELTNALVESSATEPSATTAASGTAGVSTVPTSSAKDGNVMAALAVNSTLPTTSSVKDVTSSTPSTPHDTGTTSRDPTSNRAALQGSLALLAAQLAELADITDDSTAHGESAVSSLPEWHIPTETSTGLTSTSGFNILEGIGLDALSPNIWAGLRGLKQ